MAAENPVDSVTGWPETKLVARRDWAPGLATFTFDLVPEPFAPGQFINLAVEHAGTSWRRSYSIASAPGAPLELLITRVGAGALTPHLFDVQVGERVRVSPRALGFFTPQFVPQCRDLWLVATGTGLGPYISMLRSGALLPLCERLLLVHGVRESAHLAYRAELEALAALPESRLRYLPTVSQEAPSPGRLSGRVTTLLGNGELERAAQAPLDQQAHLLLCGNPAMIQDVESLLQLRGFKKHRKREPGHYSYEKYW